MARYFHSELLMIYPPTVSSAKKNKMFTKQPTNDFRTRPLLLMAFFFCDHES